MLVRNETIEDESLNILKSNVPVPCNSFTSQGVTTTSAGLGNRITFRLAGRPSRKEAMTDCNRVRAFSAISKGLPTIQSSPHLFSSAGHGKLKRGLLNNHNNCNDRKEFDICMPSTEPWAEAHPALKRLPEGLCSIERSRTTVQ